MNIITSNTPAKTAGAELTTALHAYHDTPILLLLSGGSALSILEYVDGGHIGPHVTITTLDERFSSDSTINTFAHIKATDFYIQAHKRGAHSIDTRVTAEDTLRSTGEKFCAALHRWRNTHTDGVMLATMGMGNDGHTAGIFPGEYGVDFSGKDWVVAYTVPPSVNQYTERITVTYSFLRDQLTHAIMYIVGDDKKIVLKQLQQSNCIVDSFPACVVHDLPNVTIVTDQTSE